MAATVRFPDGTEVEVDAPATASDADIYQMALAKKAGPAGATGEGTPKPTFFQALGGAMKERAGEIGQLPSDFVAGAQRQIPTAVRIGGPIAVGAAGGGLGLGLPAALGLGALAGGVSEYGAEKLEGAETSPLRIGLSAALGGLARPGRAVAEAVRGGAGRMGTALKAGGTEPVDPTKLMETVGDVTRRLGPHPPAVSSGRVLGDVTERVTRPGPLTLQDVEDIRRNVGSAAKTFRSPATKEASSQLYGASKGTMEQDIAGPAGQLLEGIGAEGARKALTQKFSLTEMLSLLGGLGGALGGYGATGSPQGLIAGASGLLPLLTRLYGAAGAVRPGLAVDAAAGGAANAALQRWLTRNE